MSTARQPGAPRSFVSTGGLVMTNHHCARSCIDAVSREGEDLLGNGFYAKRREDERPCPNFTMDQLRGIRDVTDSVNAAVPPGTDPNRAADLRAARSRDIEQRCNATGPGLFCQVVTMYRGGGRSSTPSGAGPTSASCWMTDHVLRRGPGQLHLPPA
jgi:hypothetical protein